MKRLQDRASRDARQGRCALDATFQTVFLQPLCLKRSFCSPLIDSNAYGSRSIILLLLVLHLPQGFLKLSGYLTAQLQGDH